MASGSEQRQRTAHLMVRLTPAERGALDAAAERAGLSLAGYARATLLTAPPVRQARRPPVERAELVRLLAQLGKIGSQRQSDCPRAEQRRRHPARAGGGAGGHRDDARRDHGSAWPGAGRGGAMIIKGSARAGGAGLAAHLKRTDTNERVAVLELRDVAGTNLDQALREMEALASGTRCKSPLYHANIDPRADERLTPQQWTRAVDALEEKLGFMGQPRAVVQHVKDGRAHVHVVWSRIDVDRMRAIPDSHNYRKHEEVSRALEREFGHARVQGAHAEREGVERPARTPSRAEMQQAERSGIDPKAIKAELSRLVAAHRHRQGVRRCPGRCRLLPGAGRQAGLHHC